MKERPILFSAPMVRAILDGCKTQTRRVVKASRADFLRIDNPSGGYIDGRDGRTVYGWDGNVGAPLKHRFGEPGDRLWVRETWAETDRADGTPVVSYAAGGCVAVGRGPQRRTDDFLIHDYAWPDTPEPDRWRPSIYMPRWASRISLEITSVRVERLQGISDSDALAEGIDGELCRQSISKSPLKMGYLPVCAFAYLWDQINGTGSWGDNPWVWVVEFNCITKAYEEATRT